ncbi:hypothetical protein AVEN_202283-1 [Araneus ventricosus]|uniref:CCHC-type domain-containing protein n=1 Tax=Araneus ventricosus TaxID=182803 RepID=A0A4Y2GPR6_ARAVE|nr:hypothetical protein AVEN_202283-1 [Araneus ventricosus]
MERLRAEIDKDDVLSSNIDSKQPRKRNPSIILNDAPNNSSMEAIQLAIMAHTGIDQSFKLRFQFSGSKPYTTHCVFEIPAQDFRILKRCRKIPIHWHIYTLRGLFHLKICGNCQSFGHTARECLSSEPTCARCADHLLPESCDSCYISCVNCLQHNIKYGTQYSLSHSVRNKSFPCFLKQIKGYKKSRDYS